MPNLRFSDGVTLDTSGPLRAFPMMEGGQICWYVLGRGMSIPVASQEEAREVIKKLSN